MNPHRRARRPASLSSSARERALDALALSRRDGLSLRRASALARVDPRTVRRHAGSAFRKSGRRWVPTAFDRLPREMTVLTRAGPAAVTVRDSRTATALAEHANAVATYVETGDEEPLRRLRRRRVRIRGQPIDLPTDPYTLDRLAAGGELAFEVYRRA
jgi:hypothetical protein